MNIKEDIIATFLLKILFDIAYNGKIASDTISDCVTDAARNTCDVSLNKYMTNAKKYVYIGGIIEVGRRIPSAYVKEYPSPFTMCEAISKVSQVYMFVWIIY